MDHETRVLPDKHEDPWNPKPKPIPSRTGNPGPPQPRVATVPVGAVLRHVEHRRMLTVTEAEKKMNEIVKDLFRCERGA